MAKKDIEIELEEMPVDNVGIMQGFLEMMNEDDDLEEGDDDLDAGIMLGRTPDSPEILMNNLRGDMRSIDARRDELADMVGYAAAAETPESVLAMLQPVLAQQGIAGMMPPGPMPAGGISPVGQPNMPNVPNVPNVPNMPSEMMAPMQPMPAGGLVIWRQGPCPPDHRHCKWHEAETSSVLVKATLFKKQILTQEAETTQTLPRVRLR
jgi:hypothetical protein